MGKGVDYNMKSKKNIRDSYKSIDNYSNITNKIDKVQDYIKKENFGKIIVTAKNFQKNIDKASDADKQKYSILMSKRLDVASNEAIKYFEKNKYTITDAKHHEIVNLVDFSLKFKKEYNPHEKYGIEKTLRAFSLAAIGFSILSNSTKLTGNVISSSNFENFSLLGTSLFFMGIVGAFLTRKK